MKRNVKEATRDRVLDEIMATLAGESIPAATLIRGAAGSELKEVAMTLSKTILCGQGGKPCLACRSCAMFTAKSHPSFLFIEPEKGAIRIGPIRDLREELLKKQFYGERRVIFIDRADRMNRNAANALLKSMEEPPGGTYFILTACSLQAVPGTIRSRCAIVTIPPFSRGDLLSWRDDPSGKTLSKKDEMDITSSEGNRELFLCLQEKKVPAPREVVQGLISANYRKISEIASTLKDDTLLSPALITVKRAILDLIMLSMGEKGCIIDDDIINTGNGARLIADPQKLVDSFYILSSLERMSVQTNRALICESVLLSLLRTGA